MYCFSVFVVIFALIVKSSAQNSTDLDISGQKAQKSFAEVFADILGQISFVTAVTFISPFILKTAIFPLFLLLKLISKPFMMIGITGWLMVALTPFILARSGMTSPVFESRSQSNDMFSMMANILSTNMSVITSQTMGFFELDNEDCKLEISCRFGKRIANSVPYIQYFIQQSGAANWIESKYMAKMFRSMTDPQDCPNICRSLDRSQSDSSYSTDTSDSSKTVFEWLG